MENTARLLDPGVYTAGDITSRFMEALLSQRERTFFIKEGETELHFILEDTCDEYRWILEGDKREAGEFSETPEEAYEGAVEYARQMESARWDAIGAEEERQYGSYSDQVRGAYCQFTGWSNS
jgi:hypothetical protein